MGQKRRLLAVSSPVFKKAGTFVSKLGAEPHAPAAGRKIKVYALAARFPRFQKSGTFVSKLALSPTPRLRAEKQKPTPQPRAEKTKAPRPSRGQKNMPSNRS